MKKRRILSAGLTLLLAAVLFAGCARSESAAEPAETAAPAPAEEIEIQTVETAAFSMDYFRFGHGSGTLVILPGLSVQSVMGSAAAVAESYRQMTDDFTIYLFDRRKELPQTYSADEMARDTEEAILALGLEDVCLFGASQGGMLALQIAADQPALVRGVVAASATARMTDEQFRPIEEWIRFAEDRDAAGLYLAFGEVLYPPEVFEQSRDLLLSLAEGVTEEDMERFVVLAESMRGFDVTGELEKISCPVLVTGDRTDRIFGAAASEELGERLGDRPDCELYLYDGYGHAVYDLAPDFKDRMTRFLLQ